MMTSSPATTVFAHVREVFDRMLGEPTPAELSTADLVLVGTGRIPVDDVTRDLLGPAADRLPLLG